MKQRTVTLKPYHDDFGSGLIAYPAIDKFDPFYTGLGIFHDVFEHYFEEQLEEHHYRYQIEGEIIASGHCLYFYHHLCIKNRFTYLYTNDIDRSIRRDTIDEIYNYITDAHSKYIDNELFQNVAPKNYSSKILSRYDRDILSNWASRYVDELNESFRKHFHELEKNFGKNGLADAKKRVRRYIRSVTEKKILNLVTYGFVEASRQYHNTDENYDVLYNFIEEASRITKSHSASSLIDVIDWVEIILDLEQPKISYAVEVTNGYNKYRSVNNFRAIDEMMEFPEYQQEEQEPEHEDQFV